MRARGATRARGSGLQKVRLARGLSGASQEEVVSCTWRPRAAYPRISPPRARPRPCWERLP